MTTYPSIIARFLRWLTLAVAFGLSGTAIAEIPEELQAKLDTEVTKELDQAIAQLLPVDYVARELFLEAPVEEPAHKLEILSAQIEQAIERDAFTKFPQSEVAKYGRKSEELFPLLGRGDEIEVEFAKDGRTVKGYVVELSDKIVKINNLPIRIDELTDASQAYFDKRNAYKKRQTYIRARTAELVEQRRQYRDSLRESRRKDVLNKSGYIRIDGEWRSRLAYLTEELNKRRKELYEKLEPLAVFKVYYANGLVFFREQWMTAEEAAEIKRLLEEAAKAQAAEQAAENAFDDVAEENDAGTEDKQPEPAPKAPEEEDIWD